MPRVADPAMPSPSETMWDPSWWPRDGSSLPMELVGYFALVMGAIVLVWMAWLYAQRVWQQTAPLRLFVRIATELKLTRRQMWWLWRVARQQRLASPITLLLSRGTHDHHVQQFFQDRPGLHESAPGRAMQDVRRHLFGDAT